MKPSPSHSVPVTPLLPPSSHVCNWIFAQTSAHLNFSSNFILISDMSRLCLVHEQNLTCHCVKLNWNRERESKKNAWIIFNSSLSEVVVLPTCIQHSKQTVQRRSNGYNWYSLNKCSNKSIRCSLIHWKVNRNRHKIQSKISTVCDQSRFHGCRAKSRATNKKERDEKQTQIHKPIRYQKRQSKQCNFNEINDYIFLHSRRMSTRTKRIWSLSWLDFFEECI